MDRILGFRMPLPHLTHFQVQRGHVSPTWCTVLEKYSLPIKIFPCSILLRAIAKSLMVHKIQPYFPSVFPFSYFIPTEVLLLLCFQVRAFELAIHSTWNLSSHVKPGLCFTPPSNVTFLLRLIPAILFKIAPLLHPVNSIFFFLEHLT